MQLLCFPHAGASAMVYQRWRRQVPDGLVIKPMELPGRGSRMQEPPVTDWDVLINGLAADIVPVVGRPFALFGHSFGALVAYELAHRLRELGLPPKVLIVSGTHAPGCRDHRRIADWDSDDGLRAELQRLNGTDAAVFADEELMALTLPVLRADFRLCGQYVRRDRPPLALPLHVLAGTGDETTPATLAAWRQESTGEFTLDYFDGGHFFIQDQQEAVLATLCRYLHFPQGSASMTAAG